eukprot:Sspe_Gene.107152::Locus_85235_Transcript_1_1_Confidence_1.000_Length_1145::g.107152::m.107152
MTLNLVLRNIPGRDQVLYMSFNQDSGCFAIGTEVGFRIYNCDPFRETFRRRFPNGGIGIVEMLFRCNILALVGGGKVPCFPKNRVKLWDDHTMQVIGDLSFKDDVRAVKLSRNTVLVATEAAIFQYSFDKLELKHKHGTELNPLGIFALCSAKCVLACPSLEKGSVRIEHPTDDQGHFISAHNSSLAMIALNADGTLLATASEKGTIIRVFSTAPGGKLVKELRRGTERALIYSICFSPDSRFLVTCSSQGTVHVFSLADTDSEKNGQANNRRSMLSMFKTVSPYFGSEWSFAWYNGLECASICNFGAHSDTLYVLGADGTFLKLTFDTEKGGECQRKNKFQFPGQDTS